MTRKAAVFGCAGQLGVELVRELGARGYVVNAWDRSEVDVSEEEPQAAFLVNALAVRNLALACRQCDATLVHFSTDYVFDGFARHPYAEDDPTHPLSAYAVSKLAGEHYAQAYLENVLVVRTSG